MGTKAVVMDNALVTMHKIPFTPWKVGYCPKVKPKNLDLERIYRAGRSGNLIFVKLDVPHAPADYRLPTTNYRLREGRPIFARSTILLNLIKSNEEILAKMREKARYNLGLAQKKGVVVKIYPNDPQGRPWEDFRSRSAPAPVLQSLGEGGGQTPGVEETAGLKKALEEFIRLQKETAKRQKFFIHPDRYYRTCFEVLAAQGMAYLITAKVGDKTAASWMLFKHGDVLYYPYGESDYELRSFMPSNLVMWEAIQLGKNLGCKVFDLWGAANDPDDEKDPWHGFTRFKLSFGGMHLKLPPTDDLIINEPLYKAFNLVNNLRWKILRAERG